MLYPGWVDNQTGKKPAGWSDSEGHGQWTTRGACSRVGTAGSILGSVLLNVVISDLDEVVKHSLISFADIEGGWQTLSMVGLPFRGT